MAILMPVKFSVDYFDSNKRAITTPEIGTFEYKKSVNKLLTLISFRHDIKQTNCK